MDWKVGGGSCECKSRLGRPRATQLTPRGILSFLSGSLVEGVATVGIAVICIFILPDHPQKARLLTSREKDRLVYRLQMDRGQVDNSSEISAFKGFMMAVTDPKTWLLCGILTST